MIKPTYEILNQRGTPMFFSDVFANRPTPGIVGRIFISTDTFEIYRDTGTTWDLIGGGVTGSGTTNYVSKFTSANTIGDSQIYDDGNVVLGIRTIPSLWTTLVGLQISSGSFSSNNVEIDISHNAYFDGIWKYIANGTAMNFYATNQSYFWRTAASGIIGNPITWSIPMTLNSSGRLLIGTSVDTGQILQINGDTFLKGSGNSSVTNALTIQNSSSIETFRVENGGNVTINTGSLFVSNIFARTAQTLTLEPGASNQSIRLKTFGSTGSYVLLSGDTFATTTGITITNLLANQNFSPTSGTAVYNNITLSNTINQTGGANGITRGLYINPGLTSAFDWRSIEMSNNVGWGLYQTGVAPHYFNGNLLLGSTTSTGERLQVTGTAVIKSNGSTLIIQDASFNNIYVFRNDTQFSIGSNSANIGLYNSVFNSLSRVEGTLGFIMPNNWISSGNNLGYAFIDRANTSTSGDIRILQIGTGNSFSPTSGTASQTYLEVRSTINQTGTSTGITRGIRINPTLTAAADWRSIEWSNNTGFGLYGVGSAPNFLNGRLQIGNAASTGESLQVTGTQRITDTRNYTTGAIQSLRLEKNLTIPSGATISTGSTLSNEVLAGTNLFQGSVTIPNSSPFAGLYASNLYNFSAGSFTITSTQATGVRALSQIAAQNYFGGSFSGTLTHVSSIQIGAFLNNSTGTITPVITNAYQLLINDINESAHTFTISNRWGIYQEGSNDRNYLAGKTLVGSSTDTGEQFQLTGSIRVNNQLSGTAGGSSGQHLIINCDGTTYKIALLNN